MRRIHPLAALAAVLFVISLALSLFTVGDEDVAIGRSASVYDTTAGGTSRLQRWLEAIGVRTSTLEGATFAPSAAQQDVLLLLGATQVISALDVAALRDYVQGGGTLVVATDLGLAERPVLDAFGAGPAGGARVGEHAVSHLAFAAPLVRSVRIDAGLRLQPRGRAEALVPADAPFVVRSREGPGTVLLVGSLAPFLNGTIGEADNARFVLNLIGAARTVAFDEYHHGVQAEEETDQLGLVTGTWPGRAMLFAGVVTFAYLLLSGRRLGPATALDPRPPRSSLDYVRGLAALLRRSGRGEIAQRRLLDELRRGLARRLGFDARAPLEQVLDALEVREPARAVEAREVVARLRERSRPEEILRIVGRIERLTAEQP
jgi:hypothetical protein